MSETSQTVQARTEERLIQSYPQCTGQWLFWGFFNTLHPNPCHNTNHPEKRDWGIHKHSSFKFKENQQSHMKSQYNKSKFGEERVHFQYQTMTWKDGTLPLTYCEDVCREEMAAVSLVENGFFSLCQIPCYRFWRSQSHLKLSEQPSNSACSKSNKALQGRYLQKVSVKQWKYPRKSNNFRMLLVCLLWKCWWVPSLEFHIQKTVLV